MVRALKIQLYKMEEDNSWVEISFYILISTNDYHVQSFTKVEQNCYYIYCCDWICCRSSIFLYENIWDTMYIYNLCLITS